MKVKLTNVQIMDVLGATGGALQQNSKNEPRFNYALDRNSALLTALARNIRNQDAVNLKGYYAAIDAEEAAAEKDKRTLEEGWEDKLKALFPQEFEVNAKFMLSVREVDLYKIKFSWLPKMPGFVQRGLLPITEAPTDIEMEQAAPGVETKKTEE